MNSDILQIPQDERVYLSVRNLTVTVQNKHSKDIEQPPLRILDNVSFDLNSGEMLAIMGGSGSGKTTLLNTLSTRLGISNKSLGFDGSIAYYTKANLPRIKNSYLLQSDVFLPGLTVFETLKYQADLRMSPTISDSEKVALIDSLLETLEMTPQKHAKVVSFSNKIFLSGGEQRRLSLAIQLLNKPSLLFLDEPTTGLDASSSLKLVTVLKKLTGPDYGLTVILSIHQPRLEITNLFDKICLLTRGGRVVYYGSLADSSAYFNSLSFLSGSHFSSKESSNFIDFIMDLSVKDTTSKTREEYSMQRIDRLVENWKQVFRLDSDILSPAETKSGFKHLSVLLSRSKTDRISFFRELTILTKRTFVLTYRDKLSMIALNGGSVFMAVTCGLIFFDPYNDLGGIRTRQSSLYAMLEIIGFAPMFIEIERLWSHDGLNFFREYKENQVSIAGFIISRRLGKLLLEDFPVGALFAIITFFLWHLRGGVGHFFVYFALTVLTTFMGMAMAMVCFSIGTDMAISSLYLNIFYQLQNSACGFFVNAKTMPVYVRWTKYIAYFWYTFGALNSNQFSNWKGTCPYNDEAQCEQYTGNYQLRIIGYPVNWVAAPIGYLCAWLTSFYILCYIGLSFKNYDLEMSKTKENKIGDEEEDDEDDSSMENDTQKNGQDKNDDENEHNLELRANTNSDTDNLSRDEKNNPQLFDPGHSTASAASASVKTKRKGSVKTNRSERLSDPTVDAMLAKTPSHLFSPLYDQYPQNSESYELQNLGVATSTTLSSASNTPSAIGPSEVDKLEKLPLTSSELVQNDESLGLNIKNINLSVLTKNHFWNTSSNEKVLLDNISAEFKGNSINAIMGPSGSGKTTLLNYISHRLPGGSKFVQKGEILLKGVQAISNDELSKISSYVTQHDNSLIASLTVRETLYFQARLRLPIEDHPRLTSIVNTLIRKIGLMDCADTVIGSEFVKGISGGEQRRVSIAIQLLSKPKILFLDEPTSGLDSSTALSILKLLKNLSKNNKTTIVLTIHQPNEDMVKVFENVLLLGKGGRVIYNGANREMKSYFSSVDYKIPENVNFTNHVLDLISRGAEEDKDTTDARIDGLALKWISHSDKSTSAVIVPFQTETIDVKAFYKKKSTFVIIMMTIVKRQFLTSIRSFDILFAKMFQTVLLAICHTLFFARLKNTQEGISNRLGLVQEVLNLYFVGLINNVSLYPIERNIFYQEYKDGIYGVAEFNLSYFINELPVEVAPCLFFAAMIVFGAGLPPNAPMFFSMFMSAFAAINCGESLGILINSAFDHLGLATNILSNITVLAIFMGGTMSLYLLPFFEAWNWINPMKYAVGICAKLGFKDQNFKCASGVECTLTTGQKVLDLYQLDVDLKVYYGALAACIVMYRVFGVISVYLKVQYLNSN